MCMLGKNGYLYLAVKSGGRGAKLMTTDTIDNFLFLQKASKNVFSGNVRGLSNNRFKMSHQSDLALYKLYVLKACYWFFLKTTTFKANSRGTSEMFRSQPGNQTKVSATALTSGQQENWDQRTDIPNLGEKNGWSTQFIKIAKQQQLNLDMEFISPRKSSFKMAS